MPFVIIENGQNLEIAWSDDKNAQNIDANILNESYKKITVEGYDNIEFTDCQIFNRTKSLGITGCTVDLSKIYGSINYLNFNKCKCINSFSNQCSIASLYLFDVELQVSQLIQVKVNKLQVIVSDEAQFDYQNCYLLQCNLHSLTLTNQQVNLNIIQGTWDSVIFQNSQLIGQVDNNLFKVKFVDVIITEQNCSNNQQSLESLACDQFNLSQLYEDNYQQFDLFMTNQSKQKKQMYAQFKKCFCDLSLIQGSWNNISFHNCMLIGNPKNYKQQQFSNTNISITLDQHSPEIDLSPLHGIACKVSITLNNVQVDLSSVAKCKPFQLNLKDCNLDCAQLVGNWNILNIFNCEFKQTNDLITASIIAEKIIVSNVDSKLLDYFSTKVLEISQLKQPLLKFPNVNQLIVKQSAINMQQPNDTVQQLQLINANLIKFSILNVNYLQLIDLNSIQKHHTDFNTKQKILSYLQFQKKNKGTIKNLKRRADNHRNGVEKHQIFLNQLKVYLENNLYKMVQGSFALSYE
ncbi:Hypothetical_protein [Hexamita inflata]|uniref:Hypothetical_protein n=1 Tax=Hexamita inflata TaxID=28002 RepID=A0AA86PQN2_9EUKA|nr:Hypothetical protein HINF_LOCUS31536 [Hexamita inflata]